MRRNIVHLAVLVALCAPGLAPNAHAKCSNATLSGRYALRTDASPVEGGRRQNLALINFHGDGDYTNEGFTVNNNGVITRGTLDAKYQVDTVRSRRGSGCAPLRERPSQRYAVVIWRYVTDRLQVPPDIHALAS